MTMETINKNVACLVCKKRLGILPGMICASCSGGRDAAWDRLTPRDKLELIESEWQGLDMTTGFPKEPPQ